MISRENENGTISVTMATVLASLAGVKISVSSGYSSIISKKITATLSFAFYKDEREIHAKNYDSILDNMKE